MVFCRKAIQILSGALKKHNVLQNRLHSAALNLWFTTFQQQAQVFPDTYNKILHYWTKLLTAEAVEQMCLALKLFIKMCIACRYFIVWLQQLSPHLLGCSQRDQAKCCSHISKCDDYSCLATLDQTWFHLCCKCHFKWLSVCRSPCSPSFHFSNSFLSTIHPCVYNSLPLNSLFSISSVIYLLPASFF